MLGTITRLSFSKGTFSRHEGHDLFPEPVGSLLSPDLGYQSHLEGPFWLSIFNVFLLVLLFKWK